MERERFSDDDLVEREIEEETEDPEPPAESEFDRRAANEVFHGGEKQAGG